MTYETLRQKPEIKEEAAEWFHDKWGVPKDAYLQCMETYINKETEYGWYLCLEGHLIIGGLCVGIERGFDPTGELLHLPVPATPK